jgi:UDP-2,3-diacylglucosamine pyrophosphatase LpxH
MQLDSKYKKILSVRIPEQKVYVLCCGEQHRQSSENVMNQFKIKFVFLIDWQNYSPWQVLITRKWKLKSQQISLNSER